VLQILVEVAIIQAQTLKSEVEEVSWTTALVPGLAGPYPPELFSPGFTVEPWVGTPKRPRPPSPPSLAPSSPGQNLGGSWGWAAGGLGQQDGGARGPYTRVV